MSGERGPALVVRRPGEVVLEERGAPTPGPGEVLIRPETSPLSDEPTSAVASVEALSMAMTSAAPAVTAPVMAAIPTPPTPMTATWWPGCTLATLIEAPMPVATPHDTSAPATRGARSRSRWRRPPCFR